MYSVASFLNFALIDNYDRYQITQIEELTIEMLKDYLNWYSLTHTTNKGVTPSQSCVKAKRNQISDFLVNLCAKYKLKHINKEMLVAEFYVLNPKTSYKERSKKYLISVKYRDASNGYRFLYRDMPLEIVERFIKEAKLHDKELVFPIALMAYAGLRIGEVVNIRREESCFGPNLIFTRIDDDYCTSLAIDLTKELTLRGDGIRVGKIKKERYQNVCPAFVHALGKYLNYHRAITRGKPLEKYAPMFVSKNISGNVFRAITKEALTSRIKKLFFNYVLPSLKNDANPKFQIFYESMQGHTWGPHSFRHWFSVVLVLMGFDEAQLMSFRGDKSIDSSRAYLTQKGELQMLYENANEILGEIINE